jgi:peptidoglycan hydrolase CwlO-like protein
MYRSVASDTRLARIGDVLVVICFVTTFCRIFNTFPVIVVKTSRAKDAQSLAQPPPSHRHLHTLTRARERGGFLTDRTDRAQTRAYVCHERDRVRSHLGDAYSARDAMGVETIADARSTVTTKTTTTMTMTTTSVDATVVSASTSNASFGSYFMNMFGGGEAAPATDAVADSAPADAKPADFGSDGLHAKLGTALRKVQDAYDTCESKASAAQMVFEAATKELSAAHERLADAKKSGLPGLDTVAERTVKAATSKADDASAAFMKAQDDLKKAEAAKRKAEVEHAESLNARQLRSKMFNAKLSDEQFDLDAEARRLSAVVKLQRAYRRHLRRKHARDPKNIVRVALLRIFSREGVFAMLMAFLIFSGSLFSFESVEQKPTQWMETMRTFSSLDHGYKVRGITDANVMAQLTVLRARHDKLRVSVDECESTLRNERSSGWMSSSPSCTASLRAAERKVAHLMKDNSLDASLAENTRIKLLEAELAVTHAMMQTERTKHNKDIQHLHAVHAAESEVILAQAQANVMDAHHEGARRFRESQFAAEDLVNENAMLKERIASLEKERRGDPIGIRALTSKHDSFVKRLQEKHDASVRAIDSDYRAKLSAAKAEVVVHKNKDLASLAVLRNEQAKVVADIENLLKLEKARAAAAEDNVCASKGSRTLALLVYPLIAAVALLLTALANSPQHPTRVVSEENHVETSVVGVPVCKRCDKAEGETAKLRARADDAEKKLSEMVASLDSTGKERASAQEEFNSAKDKIREVEETLADTVALLAKKTASLDAKEKQLAEMRDELDAANVKLASAVKKIAEKMTTLDSTGKERMEMQDKIDDLAQKLNETSQTLDKSKALLKDKQQLIDTLLATRTENEQKIEALEGERTELTTEQERLIEDVVNKQEEIDALMAELEKKRAEAVLLVNSLEDATAEKKTLEAQLLSQEELILISEDKSLTIIDLETSIEALTSRIDSLKAQLKSAEQKHEETLTQLKNRDTRVTFLEDEISSMRSMQEKTQSRMSDQLKRLGELEMQEGRNKIAREAAEAKAERLQDELNALLARSEGDIKANSARFEEEITQLQAQLSQALTEIASLRSNEDLTSSKLRQDARQLEDALEKLALCGKEKAEKQEEIERLQLELEELRRRLAELLNETEMTSNAPLEEQRSLVYDEAGDMLSGMKRITLLSLLYTVSFATVRDLRQFRSLTINAMNDIDRPPTKKVNKDALFYAKKRAARAIVHLAQTPALHNVPLESWPGDDNAMWKAKIGWGNHDEVWEWSTRALAAISRIFQGANAYQLYQLSGLQTALELMRYASGNRDIQMHGSRAVSGLMAYELAYYAQEAPQIVSGSALETLAQTLTNFPSDVQVVRAASRAVWVCVHLGKRFGAHTFVQQKIYEPLLVAMAHNSHDLKVIESCCGAVLAAAARDDDCAAKLLEAGVRDEVRDTLQRVESVSYSGAFVNLKHWWLFEA